MSEILILEQFMRMVSPDMAVWIKEHDPGTAEEAARLAEVYISAQKSTTGNSFSQWTPRPQIALAASLPHPVVLGQDLPILGDLISQSASLPRGEGSPMLSYKIFR
ncbi:hypothetical protein SRHO_G00250590 [Serrasalmus rhombeus]